MSRTDSAQTWTTSLGTIRKGMAVLAPDGRRIGTVEAVEGGEILLEDEPGEPAHAEIPLTLVDGVSQDAVLLQPRGDATFGLGAQP